LHRRKPRAEIGTEADDRAHGHGAVQTTGARRRGSRLGRVHSDGPRLRREPA
jgi:hypothetical protein